MAVPPTASAARVEAVGRAAVERVRRVEAQQELRGVRAEADALARGPPRGCGYGELKLLEYFDRILRNTSDPVMGGGVVGQAHILWN